MPSGFLTALALAGGAVGGWGKGELENIKQTREEKLRKLELDRAERLQTLSQNFQAGEGDKNRASQEAMTKAQQATTMAVANLNADVTRGEGAANRTLNREEIQSRETTALAGYTSAEKIAAADRAAAAPLVTTKDGQSGVLDSGIFKPTVDAQGKPVKILTNATENSADAKTIQYLLDLGTPLEEAKKLVLENKNKDPSVIGASIFNNIMDVSRRNMGNPTPEEIESQVEAAVGHTRRALREFGLNPDDWTPAPAPATGTPDAPAPTSATEPAATGEPDIDIPSTMSDADLKVEVDAAIAGGVPKETLKRILVRKGRDPTKVGL